MSLIEPISSRYEFKYDMAVNLIRYKDGLIFTFKIYNFFIRRVQITPSPKARVEHKFLQIYILTIWPHETKCSAPTAEQKNQLSCVCEVSRKQEK